MVRLNKHRWTDNNTDVSIGYQECPDFGYQFQARAALIYERNSFSYFSTCIYQSALIWLSVTPNIWVIHAPRSNSMHQCPFNSISATRDCMLIWKSIAADEPRQLPSWFVSSCLIAVLTSADIFSLGSHTGFMYIHPPALAQGKLFIWYFLLFIIESEDLVETECDGNERLL